MKYFIALLASIAITFSVYAESTDTVSTNSLLMQVIKDLGALGEQNKVSLERINQLENKVRSLEESTSSMKDSFWPHSINCGSDWDAIFMLHGNPIKRSGSELAWYVQVYPNEYRYVRFSANGSYHDRAGHNGSSIGCEKKSIDQLRLEGRTYQVLAK